jgi:hypothetical protein
MHGPASRELRGIPSGITFSKARGCNVRGPPFAAGFVGGPPLASRRGVGGAIGGGAGGVDSFAGGTTAVARGVGAGGADVTAGPAGGVVGGGELAGEGDGIGAEGVGGAAACSDRRMIRFSKKELTDDIAASERSRAAMTSATYPEICRLTPTRPRVLNSTTASSATPRNRMGCRNG